MSEPENDLARLRLRLAAKEREVEEIYRSRAWRLVASLRSLKQRLGIRLPHRRAVTSAKVIEPAAPHPDKYDVICLAIHDWDFRFQRAQQLMSRFAAAGHRVFYAGPDAAPPFDDAKDAVIIVQHPQWWPIAKAARERFGWPIVYDCMDLHSGFADADVKHEEELFASADLVVVTSDVLKQHSKRGDALVIRNGCDFDHFATKPVIGYYGAIADWFDSELVSKLAEKRPDWQFLLIGSLYGATLARLAELPNVSLPGEQAYESIPDWLARFDVAIIPFKRTKLTEATNPVKVYEMLAAGKAVVSVPIPEVAALAPLVRLASTADEFEREIEAELSEAERRRAFAKDQTWDARFEVLARAISETRARK